MQDDIKDTKTIIAYAKLTIGWSQIKVPLMCYVEHLPVFTYNEGALINSESGYWVVGYTEMVEKTAALVYHDSYDNYRL